MREVVGHLIQQRGCRIVALAEVRQQSVLHLIPEEARETWDELRDLSGDRHDFDVAIAFDRARLTLIEHRWVRGSHAGQRVRAGLVGTFCTEDESDWLIVVAAHWRSDMGNAEDAGDRRLAAAASLREAIAASVDDVAAGTPVLILGDFNAEPFSRPFGAALPTARSRAEVQRRRPRSGTDLLFYNASWRLLGERFPWSRDDGPPSLAGIYRLDGSSAPTAWRTFDQVLVSPSLLGGDAWTLDERALAIVDDACIYDRDKSRPCRPFDHLPIVGHLERFTSTRAP